MLGHPGSPSEQAAAGQWVDTVLRAAVPAPLRLADLVWCLTPRGALPADRGFTERVSRELDRSLTASVDDGALLRSVDGDDLVELGVDRRTATDAASTNLDRLLREATLESGIAGDVPIAWFGSEFPAKASLLLAPALRGRLEPTLGWPVLAVAPARDFLLLWPAARRDLVPRLEITVRREFLGSAHPLSPEVFTLDGTITAIGRLDV